MRRPFNALAEGLVSENSRDAKTAIEFFLTGLWGWEAGLLRKHENASRDKASSYPALQAGDGAIESGHVWLEKVQEIWEGNYKRLDALLAELKQAQKEERNK